MAGTFFQFEGTLPTGLDEDPSHGLDEEEEEYDALNDETFGTAADDDWEGNHEVLAKLAENSRQNEGYNISDNQDLHNDRDDIKNGQDLEASLSQLVLEDSDEVAINNKSTRSQLTQSNLVTYPNTPIGLRNSVWAVGKHDVPSPLSTSSPVRPQTALSQSVKNVCTVEELERNLLHMRSGDASNSSPSVPGLGIPNTGAALRLEDVERKLTQTISQPTLQQPRLNLASDITTRPPPGLGRTNMLLNLLQSQRLVGTGRIEPPQLPMGFNSPSLAPHLAIHQQHSFQPIHSGPGILQLGPHQQQLPQHLTFNMNGPRIPPFSLNNRIGPPGMGHRIQLPHQQHIQHRISGTNVLQPHHLHLPYQNQFMHGNIQNNYYFHQQQHQQVNGAGDFDEYAGLMTPWQKQWLLNIQTLQLNVGVPYLVDYYYTVFKSRKQRIDSSENVNTLMDRVVARPESTKPGRERPPSVMGPAKAYTPLQFENSLGKLQCVSVTAPRKLIDMEVMSPEGPDGQSSQRDIRKTKQLLLEIERMYVSLLELEDQFNPLALQAIAEAAATKSDSDSEIDPVKASPEELVHRMTSLLMQGDKIAGFMGIRKGKTLLLRLLPHVAVHIGLHTVFWTQVLNGLATLVRRDQTDALLIRFLPELDRWLKVCSLPQLLKLISLLVAEANPKVKSSKTVLATAVSSKFGVLALAAILTASEKYLESMTEDEKNQWLDFMTALATAAETSRMGEDNSIPPLLPHFPTTLQSHLDFCAPVITNKQILHLKYLFMIYNTNTESDNLLKTETALAYDKVTGKSAKFSLQTLLNK